MAIDPPKRRRTLWRRFRRATRGPRNALLARVILVAAGAVGMLPVGVALRLGRALGLAAHAVLGTPRGFALAHVTLAFLGLAFSLYPYIVIDRLTVWQAASATKSLIFIFVGVAVTLPAIIAYTVFMYRVFWGKARELSYLP